MNNQEKLWRKGELYLVVLLFAFTLMVVIGALEFPYKARIFPLLVGSAGLLLMIMDILHMLIPKFGARFRSLRGGELFEIGKGQRTEEAPPQKEETVRLISIVKTFLWFIGAFICFYVLGYLLFSIVFMFLFLKFYTSLSLIRSLEITIGFCLGLWMAFSLFLKLDIFAGSALF